MSVATLSAASLTAPVQNDLLHPEAVAELLHVTSHTLAVWRSTGRYSLPFVRVGRKILYRRSDLEIWLESRRVAG